MLSRLSSVQILTIHMARLRLRDGDFTEYELQYLHTLPSDFTFHPTYWQHDRVRLLPKHAQKLINDVRGRYTTDLAGFEEVFDKLEDTNLISKPLESYTDTFKWAWLVVNTRCLFYPIKDAKKESQLSLCPYLDLLNHTSPTPNTDNLFNSLPKPEIPMKEGGYELLNNSDRIIEPDTEIYFMYGPHSDEFLLAEYGFGLGWQKNAFTEVNVSEEVTHLIKEDWKREELEQSGLWDDYTLHLYPSPAWPSQRTLMALRLACLERSDVEGWRRMVSYEIETVSEKNETRMRTLLAEICESVGKVSDEMMQKNQNDDIIKAVWKSTRQTATQVHQSLKTNVSF